MATYTNEQYLLDRALIDDTTTKLWFFVDQHLPKEDFVRRASTELLMPEVHYDYTALYPGEPATVTGAELAATWAGLIEKIDGYLHHTAAMLTDLPLPDGQVQRPEAAVVERRAITIMRKGDKTAQNGCLITLNMKRLDGVKGNPWRVAALKISTVAYVLGHLEDL